jgi:hypothetical protein
MSWRYWIGTKLIKLLVGNIFLNSEPEVSVKFYLSITEVRLVQNFTMFAQNGSKYTHVVYDATFEFIDSWAD